MSLNGSPIANNSFVNVDDIGKDDDALHCCTDKSDCCKTPNRAGEWYYPNGSRVGIMGPPQNEFYRDRDTQVVRLNHRQGTFTETLRGRFRCEVPDTNNNEQSIHAYIGMHILW